MLWCSICSYWATGVDPQRTGAAHAAVAPYQVYDTADGQAMLGAWTDAQWSSLCRAIGREELVDDPLYVTNQLRVVNREALNAIFEPAIARRTNSDWATIFASEGVMFAPVLPISQILAHPQVEALGLVQTVEHPTVGTVSQIGPPIHMSRTPGAITTAPPLLGEHGVDILRELNYSHTEIRRLSEIGVLSIPEGIRK